MRRAIFDIWLNRDYTRFAQLNNLDMSLPNWDPAQRFRLYIRKDIAAKIWNYGVAPSPEQAVIDPYQGKGILVAADKILGGPGNGSGQFNRPRGIAVAPDGSLYIADTDNNRIQHIAADGTPINSWGTFADILKGPAPEGTMNQPWGVAVGLDGSVYVADTFNFRIEKYTADGQFIKMWGYFGQAEKPEAFWGPRDVAVDSKGQLYVVDTGNKRIVVFDADGNYISQFGSVGLGPGQFDEPVGIAFGPEGQIYITDTWNQRIQEFTRSADGSFVPLTSWDVSAWYGQSLDNKPYLTVDANGHVFATDPEGARVLEWDGQGQFIRYFGESGSEPTQFGLVGAVKVDPAGGLWVTDAGNSRLMHFVLP
jgi:DNA-binding beta-propeller fold protein YncE